MSSSEFVVTTAFRSLATRESGARAREVVLRALTEHPVVTLNFANACTTPSFADELVGRLAEILGEQEFRQRVRIRSVSPAERALLHHVVQRHLHRRHNPQSARAHTHDDAFDIVS